MKKFSILIACFQIAIIFAQDKDLEKDIAEATAYVAEGNEVLIRDGNFPKAEGEYRKAIAKNPADPVAKYNLANSYYNTEKYDEAHQRYIETAKVATSKLEKHKAFHNQGNTYMEQKKYQEAVEAYKNALRNNPKDDETRYNLALAKKMLEQQQQQNDQNQDNKDQNKDQNQDNKDQEGDNKEKEKDQGEEDKDKEGDQKDKGDQGEDKDDKEGEDEKDKEGDPKDEKDKGKDQEDKKDGEGKPEDQQQQPPQQVQGQLSPQQVKNLLEAMNNEEKKVQDKINAKKVKGTKTRTDKDW